MIGRIIWFTTLAAVAVLVSLLQIDKQSEKTPALAAAVPAPLRNYAQIRIAQAAVSGENAAQALDEAQRLVKRRPVPADYLVLLAAGQAKAGQTESALRTIQIAGKRGWREPAAQEAVLRIALAAGDKAEAARRYAALFLRDGTPDALLQEVGPAMLDEPGGIGQQTLIAIVVGGERWWPMFLRRGPLVMPPAAFTAIAAASMAKGAKFDCGQLDLAIRRVSQRDAAAGAALTAARARSCPQRPSRGKSAL